MAPIRTYSNWNTRTSNKMEQIEPYKHYYFICEGQNTERWYFEKFIELRKEFNISPLISINYLEKTDEHSTWSDPKKLYELAGLARHDISFDTKYDKMIIVFDADIFEKRVPSEYNSIIEMMTKENIVCVTNPSFELFLLLHFENSLKELILPNMEDVLNNDWVNKKGEKMRYIEWLFRKKSNLKPKKHSEIAQLVNNISVAIEQEQEINNDINLCRGTLTSNIGVVLKHIMDDKCGFDK